MQLQGLLFMLFMMVLIPIMIISTNHNVFFITLALVLFISSIRKVYFLIFNIRHDRHEEESDSTEDLQDLLNLDVKKFGTGLKVAKNLCIILFLVYSSLYIHTFWTKVLLAFLLAFWIFDIRTHLVSPGTRRLSFKEETLKRFIGLFINMATIVIIITLVYDKLSF